MSLHWPILRRLATHPLSVVAIDDFKKWRGIEILVAAFHIADALEDRCKTDTVGIMLPTSGLAPAAMLAGWILGKTVVPLNFLLRRDELQYVVENCETDTIVTVQPMLDYVATGGAIPTGVNYLKIEDLNMKRVPRPRWPSLRGVGKSEDDPAVLLYTSATSGRPKGVVLTHKNLGSNVAQCVEWADFDSSDSLVGVLPQCHSFGLTVLTLLPLTVGCKVIYSAKFVPANIVRLIREHRPTLFVAIPTMYGALLSVKQAKSDDFDSIKFLVSGGEPLPEAITSRFEERFGKRIAEGYGLTETSPVTNWCRPHEYKKHSVGRPIPGVRQRIVDMDTGRDLPPNADGEVRIAGPNIFGGYWKLPDDTRAAFDEQGWFRTGDMGRLDDDGHLYITGRIKEMLIIGGENVFPREIEEALNLHPSVEMSGVIGMRDDMRGEVPVAFVKLREGMSATEKELRQWCRERIANYKVPAQVRMMDDLPKGPTGKVLRRALKDYLVEPSFQEP
ncbi:MAG: AMP-binding protein [Phycisphaeraceae bacterium]|nr:AMP-binding protein [Phycisphaeraceae bacterium]